MMTGARRRKGQLQTMEPIVIVMVLALIGGIALLFYTRMNDSNTASQSNSISLQQDTALLATLSRMPELSCTLAQTSDTKCLDIEKVKAFNTLLKRPEIKRRYYPILGNTDITIEYISDNGANGGPPGKIPLHSGLQSDNSRQTRTYFVLYDPKDEKMMFATLVVDRGVR